MTTGERALLWVSGGIVMVLLPLVLILSLLYALMSSAFLRYEYGKASFRPSDRFSSAQRYSVAETCIRYLRTDAGIEVLGALTEGEAALFNQRELRHMEDVKVVTRAAFGAHRIATALLLAAALYLGLRGPVGALGRSVLVGSAVTLGLVLLLLVAAAINFDAFFTAFHRIFFEGDTWRFLYTDTLIQLFPIAFWFDAVLLWVVGVVLESLLVGGLAYWWLRRP